MAEWMGHPMRLKLILAGLLVKFANHYATWGAPCWNKYVEYQGVSFEEN